MKIRSITITLATLLLLAAGTTTRALDLTIDGTSVGNQTLASGTNTFTTNDGMSGTVGVISGPAGESVTLVKQGGGLLTVTAAPTFTGPTHILSGTLQRTTAATFNSLDNIIEGAGSTLLLGNSLTIGNAAAGSFYVSNGGRININVGTNTLTAGTGVGGDGTLVATGTGTEIRVVGAAYIANNGATGRIDILNGAIMTVGGLMDVARQAGGNGSLFVDGAGSNVSVIGTFAISPNGTGTLSVTGGATMTTGNFNPVGTAVTSAATIIVDGVGSKLTVAMLGNLAGLATYTVSNGGQFIASGNNANSFARAVVTLGNGGLFSSGSAITMSGTLIGSGTFMSVPGIVNTAATTVIAPGVFGSAGIGELAIGGTLTLNGATLLIDTAAGNLSDKLLVNGDLLFSAARNTIDLGSFNSGTFNIITTTGTIGNTTGVLDLASIKVAGAAPSARHGIAISVVDNNTVQLALTAMNHAIEWTNGAGTGIWSAAATSTNWNAPLDPTMKFFMDGDLAAFNAPQSGNVSIVGTVTVAGMEVDGDYTFTGGSIIGDTMARTGVTATGRLAKTGAGTLSFANGANDFRGGIDIAGGIISFTNGNQLGATGTTIAFSNSGTLRPMANALTLASTIEIAAGAAATIDTNSFNLTHTGVLAGAVTGTLVKSGAGVLTLNGDSSANAGSTRIIAGTLALAPGAKLGGDAAIASGRLLVNAGAALLGNASATGAASSIAGTGTIAGNVSLSSGALLQVGGDALLAPGALNITGNLSVANSGISFDFIGGANCLINVGGILTATGSNTINVAAASLASGTYTLGNIGDIMNSGTVKVTINNAAQSTASRTRAEVFRDALAPASLLLAYGMDASRRMTWNLPGSGTWNGSLENWTGDGQTVFQNGDTVVFSTGAANAAISIENASPRVSDILVNNTGTLTFTGLGIHASATTVTGNVLVATTGKLIKAGPGALVLDNGANFFEGGIDIGDSGAPASTGGLIVFNRADQLGVGENATITFNRNGTLMPAAAYAAADTLATNIVIQDGVTGAINVACPLLSYSGTLRSQGSDSALQKTGAGTLRLLGDSGDYDGVTDIAQGMLALEGAVLGGTIHVRPGAILGGWGSATGANSVHVWSGGGILLYGTGTMDNTLNITNLIFEQNSRLIGQGTLAGAATIRDGVVVTGSVAANNTITLAGVLSGEGGTLEKTGDGDLALAAASSVHLGTLNINQGALVLRAGSQMRAKTALNINEGAILKAAGNATINLDSTALLSNNGAIEVGRAAGAANPYSTLTINGGRYTGGHGATPTGGIVRLFISNTLAGGTVVAADKLVFGPDTMVSGTTWIEIKRPANPAKFAMSEMPDLVEVQGGAAMAMPGTLFKSDEIAQAGSAYDMWFEWSPSGPGGWRQDLAAEIPLMTGLDASSMLAGKASLDAMGQRLRSYHYNTAPYQFEVWLNGLYRDDKVKTTRYDNTKADTRGYQAGAGWMRSKDNGHKTALVGLYYDYTTTRMKCLDGGTNSTRASAHGLGAYGSIKTGSWYLDGIARYSRENYTISVKDRRKGGDFETNGKGYLLAVQTGAVLENLFGYKMEPNARFAWQRHAVDAATDTLGRVYDIYDADSVEARAGINLWDEFKRKNGLKYWPRVGLSATYEFRNKSVMQVRGADQRFINNTRGFGTLLELGINAQLTRRLNLDLGVFWQHSDSLENLYFNAGIGCRW